ncbi:MAG: DUF932 domain-containing protein [Armatimonadia bacterium]
MKEGRTLQQLAVEIAAQKQTKRDFLVPANRLEMLHEDGLSLRLPVKTKEADFQEFGIRDLAHEQIAERLQIPKRYYDVMKERAPELLTRNVNHWLQTSDDTRLVRTIEGQARAFLSDRYRRLDNDELAEHLLPKLFEIPGLFVPSAEITDRRLYLQVVNNRVSGEVRKGDVVQAGVVISNSEVGCGALQIQPLVYRLVCTNGAIMNDQRLRQHHLGSRGEGGDGMELPWERLADDTIRAQDEALWKTARDVARSSLEDAIFQQALEKMRRAAGEKIEKKPQEVVELAARRFSLQDGEQDNVLAFLASGGDMTKWGLVNAVTATANRVTDYDRAVELEKVGGQILEMPDTMWRTLASN